MNLTPIFAAANSWESLLIFVGFVLVSAISNWLKKKRQGAESNNWPTEQDKLPIPRPHPSTPKPTPRAASSPPPSAKRPDWEEELRRLLGGEEATPPPPPLPIPPPPTRTVSPKTSAPAPKQVKSPPPVFSPSPSPFEMPPVLQTISVEDSPNLELSRRELELARMEESQRSYQKGMRLPGQVAEQLRQVDERVARHVAARHPRPPSEATELLRMLNQPRTARQAFVASLVFGPPKAFEV